MSNYLVKNGALIFFIQFLLYFAQSHAQQALYPVATFPDSSIAFIHQLSHEKIELYTWNSITKTVEQGLYSRFSPAHITLLPENQGFSFIDNGIIRVKFFHKRSPKSLEIAEPLYNINAVFWEQELSNGQSDITSEKSYGYFSAQYQDHYALARIDLDGHVSHLIFSKTADFLYPQKTGADLFFIARSTQDNCVHYNLCKIKFDASLENSLQKITDQEFEECGIQKTIHAEMGEQHLSDFIVLDFGTQPICFLTVPQEELAQKSVYLVAYVSHSDSLAHFAYYQIIQIQNSWHKKKLFDFSLPTSFLFTRSPNQLYEHIVPLLPKKIGDVIYFSQATSPDSADLNKPESNINIFCYNLATEALERLTHACEPGEHYFCPLKVGDSLYYGGTVCTKNALKQRTERLFDSFSG